MTAKPGDHHRLKPFNSRNLLEIRQTLQFAIPENLILNASVVTRENTAEESAGRSLHIYGSLSVVCLNAAQSKLGVTERYFDHTWNING